MAFSLTVLLTFVLFFILIWILIGQCKKFVADGAQLGETEEGNSITNEDRAVNNRVGKTVTAL